MSIAFLFPGQGAQAVGMGADLIKAFPSIGTYLKAGGEALGVDLNALIMKGPPRALAQTDVAQVCIYCLSHGIHEVIVQRGLSPTIVAGHSLGQFTAYAAAGTVSFEDGLKLVASRGRFMHEVNQSLDGGMLAVTGMTAVEVAEVVRQVDSVWVANLNAPTQHVLAGLRNALREAQERLLEAGGKGTWLEVAGPYHTPLLNDAAERFSEIVDQCLFQQAATPIIANSSATVVCNPDEIRIETHRQMLSAVNWAGTMDTLVRQQVGLLVEVGPGRVLKGLALRNSANLKCLSTGSVRELDSACLALEEACA